MRILKSQADSRNKGWLLAGALALVFSSSAWALDFDREIALQERMVVKILTAQELAKAQSEKPKENDSDSNLTVALVRADNAKVRR